MKSSIEIYPNQSHKSKYEQVVDNVITKQTFAGGEGYIYIKTFSINGNRYFIDFTHDPSNEEGEFSIDFGLTEVDGYPLTNEGLKVFGQIADEISDIYENILKQEPVNDIIIRSSWSRFSKDEILKMKETIVFNSDKLSNECISVGIAGRSPIKFKMYFKGDFIFVETTKFGFSFKYKIPLTLSFVEDIKYIAKVDISDYLPFFFKHIKDFNVEKSGKNVQIQRLNLYQYYLSKRYPDFTFDSEEVVGEDGKRTIEFKKDEQGVPVLRVKTNNCLNLKSIEFV